jgi:hypothetical protein
VASKLRELPDRQASIISEMLLRARKPLLEVESELGYRAQKSLTGLPQVFVEPSDGLIQSIGLVLGV